MKNFIRFCALAMVCVVLLSGCTNSLTDALLQRDYVVAKKYINQGSDVNEIITESNDIAHGGIPGPAFGSTPLCYSSARYDHFCPNGYGKVDYDIFNVHCRQTLQAQLDAAKLLIARGAKVDMPCGVMGNPLFSAAKYGNKDIVQLLIDSGADVNAVVEANPLLAVVEYGNVDVEALLSNNRRGDLSGELIKGVTPLMAAYGSGHLEIANLLIRHGADESQRSLDGRSTNDYFELYLDRKRQMEVHWAAEEAKARADRQASREFWAGLATGAAAVASQTASNYSTIQAERRVNASTSRLPLADVDFFCPDGSRASSLAACATKQVQAPATTSNRVTNTQPTQQSQYAQQTQSRAQQVEVAHQQQQTQHEEQTRRVIEAHRQTQETSRVANTSESSSREPKEKKMMWGKPSLENIAVCMQSAKSGNWTCNGALDNQTIVDEPSAESALARQHCSGGKWTGYTTINGLEWGVYRCGHALGAGDYDVAERYELTTTRNYYICPLLGDSRCDTLYTGQDKE